MHGNALEASRIRQSFGLRDVPDNHVKKEGYGPLGHEASADQCKAQERFRPL
jgi:hypothetical protein